MTTARPGMGISPAPGEPDAGPAVPRVLLLVPARTYRAADFLAAATRMGTRLIVGSDGALPLGDHPVVHISPADPDGTTARIMALGVRFDAVVAADTPMLAPGRRGGRQDGAAAQPSAGHNRRCRQVAAAGRLGSRRRGSAQIPHRARGRPGGVPAPGGHGDAAG